MSATARDKSPELDLGEYAIDDLNLDEARKLFRKLNTKSSYTMQFGEPPKAEEDFVVMKEKKFRELDIS
jgi:hypothetical protein